MVKVLLVFTLTSMGVVLFWFVLITPGHKHTRREIPNRKTAYNVCWFGRDAIDVLELLLPYLIVKEEVAEVVVDFYYTCMATAGRGKALTEAQEILRKSYRVRVKELNS